MSTLNKDSNKRGKFIVIYGPNNLGKSTQAARLTSTLIANRKDVLTIKYPLYNLKPTGQIINKIIRQEVLEKQKLTSEIELQKIYAQNRRDFQDNLIATLNSGINVVAEDYKGTGIAWGMTQGLDIKKLESINNDLIDPDLAILLDGERFIKSKEVVHRYENAEKWEAIRQLNLFAPNESWQRNREIHQFLAKRYGWEMVNANGTIEAIADNIWKLVKPELI